MEWRQQPRFEGREEDQARFGSVTFAFQPCSEFMIKEAIEDVKGVGIGIDSFNITDLRYADDAVLVADKGKNAEDARQTLKLNLLRVRDRNQY